MVLNLRESMSMGFTLIICLLSFYHSNNRAKKITVIGSTSSIRTELSELHLLWAVDIAPFICSLILPAAPANLE